MNFILLSTPLSSLFQHQRLSTHQNCTNLYSREENRDRGIVCVCQVYDGYDDNDDEDVVDLKCLLSTPIRRGKEGSEENVENCVMDDLNWS